jgi:predicted transposase YbfD/YdcC
MADGEYTTLADAFRAVPDPRKRRGPRYPWWLLLTLIAAAMLSGQQHGRGIGQWVREHSDELCQALGWTGPRLPSEATLRRATQRVELNALEHCLEAVRSAPATGNHIGVAVDGKALRGVRAHGRPTHLVGMVRHDGRVLTQVAVAEKSNEITAAPRLLAGRDLGGTVTTVDAELTQRLIARQIRRQDGEYLMEVKENQPAMLAAIETLFTDPPWLVAERAGEYRRYRSSEKGHGRLETRVLEASPSLNAYLDWPGIGQVLRRTCRRVMVATGEVSEEVHYGVTSLPWETTSAAMLERLWRGHWTIENRVHYVRDVTFGEDRNQAWRGHTPQALAAMRNALINLVRDNGWKFIPDAIRHYGANVVRALTVIGACPLRL